MLVSKSSCPKDNNRKLLITVTNDNKICRRDDKEKRKMKGYLTIDIRKAVQVSLRSLTFALSIFFVSLGVK